jgi:hypothetical protein
MAQIFECIISKEKTLSLGVRDDLLLLKTSSYIFEITPSIECKTKKLFKLDILDFYFDKNGRYCFYIKKENTHIYDTVLKKEINKLAFKAKLLVFNKNGEYFFVVDETQRVYLYKKDNPFAINRLFSAKRGDKIKAMDCFEEYLALGTYDGYLYIIDIYSKEKVYKQRGFVAISFLEFKDGFLVVGHIDGSISIVEYEKELSKKLTTPFLHKINSIITVENDAFIASDEEYILNIDIKNKKVKKLKYCDFGVGIKELRYFNSNLLVALLKNDKVVFVEIETDTIQIKKTKYTKSLNRYKKESFEALFREKKYSQAFIIAQNEPLLKETKTYKKLEKIFLDSLRLAAYYIKQSDKQKAKEIISIYARVESKKEIVRLLLEFEEVFLKFLEAIQKEDVKKVFDIVKKQKGLENSSYFLEFKKNLDIKLKNLEKSMDLLELDKDFGIFESLQDGYYKNKLKRVKKLKEFFDKSEFENCYGYIKNHKELKTNIINKLLKKHWQKIVEKSWESMLKADVKGVFENLKEYMNITEKQEIIGDILRGACLLKINNTIDEENYKEAEKLFYEYFELFGKDKEIEKLRLEFEKKSFINLAIDLKHNKRENRWIKMLS